ncbi:MAG: tubulin-like doman-containing protein, partial [Proteobacteria bacterium]|nr:tubulin-like doman-containing protein [Pseudomonadota bacterium]
MASLTTPTFIIGLGGIGQKVTFLVANRFENSRWGEVPETMRIRAIDSAPAEAFEIPVSRCRYFTQLGPFDANQTIQNIELFPEINKWWDYPGLTPGFIAMGAGAKRPVGRLVFFREFAKLYGVLKDDFRVPLAETLQQRLIAEGLDRVKIQQPQVYIVGSLAGGTCSGMLIDTAFLIRKLLQDVGYESGGINITAILGLQSVIEVATHDGTLNAARDRRLNAYAAVREIDYLFDGWPQDFQLDYPAPMHSFKPDQPLFNQVYLFTTAQMGGFFFNDQREILTRVAHFIFGQVASETGAVAATILDNRKDAFNPDQRRFGD